MSKLTVKRKSLTLEIKMKILNRMESGVGATEVGREFDISESTVRTIVKNKEKIVLSSQSVGTSIAATKVNRSRSSIMEKMEHLLSVWVEDMNQRRMPLSQAVIMVKAKSLFDDIKKKEEEFSTIEFKASRGWFDRFKRRSNLHSLRLQGESASADMEAADEYPSTFKDLVNSRSYPPNLVFNVDETGLFWKKLPSRTFISKNERQAPGFKAAKDRLTLLLGGNASGDLKLKPLLVYHSENPRAMKFYKKDDLPVIWTSNKKAWVTMAVFNDWYLNHFIPQVKKYCEENDLEHKALLVLDNAPGLSVTLESLQTDFPVEVVFLPPNTTSLLQPMDQGAIAAFKAYYLRRTFGQLIHETDSDKQSMKEWWKSFNIMKAIENIDLSWKEVTQHCMNGCWKKLWPEVAKNEENQVFSNLVNDITQLANTGRLSEESMEEQDIIELIESDVQPLTNEELLELKSQEEAEKEELIVPQETPRILSTKILQEGLMLIQTGLNLIEQNEVDWERIAKVKKVVSDGIDCYQQLLNERKRKASQPTLHTFFKKAATEKPHEEPQPGTSQGSS